MQHYWIFLLLVYLSVFFPLWTLKLWKISKERALLLTDKESDVGIFLIINCMHFAFFSELMINDMFSSFNSEPSPAPVAQSSALDLDLKIGGSLLDPWLGRFLSEN